MISADRVYQTVQKILNKEQRGYFPPVEFNLFANQAQIEIFENYFYDLDIYMQGGRNDSDYGDAVKNLNEKIHMFENHVAITEDDNDVFNFPANFYRLGRVQLNNIIADELSSKEISYVNLSPLTSPTRKQPVYHRVEGGFELYPQTLMMEDVVSIDYIRRPAEVSWGYNTVQGRAVYNANTTTDFELHPSELPLLILKICALAGVAVRAVDVAQIMQGEETGLMNEYKQ